MVCVVRTGAANHRFPTYTWWQHVMYTALLASPLAALQKAVMLLSLLHCLRSYCQQQTCKTKLIARCCRVWHCQLGCRDEVLSMVPWLPVRELLSFASSRCMLPSPAVLQLHVYVHMISATWKIFNIKFSCCKHFKRSDGHTSLPAVVSW
jgi:hypothetical protein